MKTDVLIIGAGPAGIFTALELVEMQADKRILIVEKGESIERRYCPKVKCGVCMKCKNCAITTGFSGAGAFSDGKLSLSADVGGDLPDLIGRELAQETIRYVDGKYLKFGADEKVEGLAHPDKVAKIRQKATEAGLRLVECPIRHMGTERAHDIYLAIEKHLIASGVEMYFNTPCKDLMIEDGVCSGAVIYKDGKEEIIYADKVVVATGRRGADWLERACKAHGIEHQPGTVDVGVRVEVKSEVMSEVNEALYESKLIGYPQPFKNKVRTFCQNPGGFVAQENYDNALAVVNGHSFKDKKSSNTNLAILCSHNFSVPFDRPIEFAQKVGELTNMLGAGRILVQRYGDILKGKRTWQKELDESSLRPTLTDAVAGDITSAMPYRSMLSLSLIHI